MFPARRRTSRPAAGDAAADAFEAADGGRQGRRDEPESLDPAAIKRLAIGYLARRDHSRAELRVKLMRRGADTEAIEQVIDALVAERLLSDRRFAESLARTRDTRYGSQRMALDLRRKGVGDEAADVLASYRAGDLDRARDVWMRRFRSAPSTLAERAKQMRFLQARGFPTEVIRQVVPRLAAGSGEDLDEA